MNLKMNLVIDFLDIVTKGFKSWNDHLVLEGFGYEHNVLTQDSLEGVGVQPQVLEGGQGGEVLQHGDHVLQTRVGGSNTDTG